MAQITVAAGTISAPMLVPPGALVTVTPDVGAYTVIEYSADNAAAVANGVATWYRRARGDATSASVYHVSDPAFLRFTPVGGGATICLDLNPSSIALSSYHSSRVVNGSSKVLPNGQALVELPEGQALTITGAAGTTGVAYLLDPVLGGTNSLRSWPIGAGALSQIGPYAGTQKFLVTCSAGSVDVLVGAAVLGAVKVTDTRRSPVMPSRIHLSLPIPPVATDGAAHTYDVQIPAKRALLGVRFIDVNLNTAAVMNISASRVGSAPKHLNSNGAECTWNANLSTVKGATSWAVPVAIPGIKANYVTPGFTVRDFEPLKPVARTDSATFGPNPLPRVRTRIPAEVQYPYQVGAFAAAWNAYSGNGGLVVGSILVNSDFVNTYPVVDTSYTLTEGGGAINPVIALFSYIDPGRSIFAFGDSLFQGVGSSIGNGGAANGVLGWPLLVDCQAPLIDTLNMSVAGQTTVDSLSTMRAFLGALDDMPTYAAIKVLSPNDGTPSQAVIDAIWGRILNEVSYLRTKGIAPMLFTSPPVNSWSSAAHGFNEAQNARAVALAAALPWIVLIDMCAIVRDPSNPRQILPAYNYDGTHFTTPGYQAIADSVMSILGS